MPRRLKALRPLLVDPGMSAAGLLGSIANPLAKAAAAPASSGPSGHPASQGWTNDGIPAQSTAFGAKRRGSAGAAGEQNAADPCQIVRARPCFEGIVHVSARGVHGEPADYVLSLPLWSCMCGSCRVSTMPWRGAGAAARGRHAFAPCGHGSAGHSVSSAAHALQEGAASPRQLSALAAEFVPCGAPPLAGMSRMWSPL